MHAPETSLVELAWQVALVAQIRLAETRTTEAEMFFSRQVSGGQRTQEISNK
jgi:hypothetical protein